MWSSTYLGERIILSIINLQGLIVKVRVPDRKVERTEGEGTFNRKGPTETESKQFFYVQGRPSPS